MAQWSVVEDICDWNRNKISISTLVVVLTWETDYFPEASERKVQLDAQTENNEKLDKGSNGDWLDIRC